jgi:hypothetical protein
VQSTGGRTADRLQVGDQENAVRPDGSVSFTERGARQPVDVNPAVGRRLTDSGHEPRPADFGVRARVPEHLKDRNLRPCQGVPQAVAALMDDHAAHRRAAAGHREVQLRRHLRGYTEGAGCRVPARADTDGAENIRRHLAGSRPGHPVPGGHTPVEEVSADGHQVPGNDLGAQRTPRVDGRAWQVGGAHERPDGQRTERVAQFSGHAQAMRGNAAHAPSVIRPDEQPAPLSERLNSDVQAALWRMAVVGPPAVVGLRCTVDGVDCWDLDLGSDDCDECGMTVDELGIRLDDGTYRFRLHAGCYTTVTFETRDKDEFVLYLRSEILWFERAFTAHLTTFKRIIDEIEAL